MKAFVGCSRDSQENNIALVFGQNRDLPTRKAKDFATQKRFYVLPVEPNDQVLNVLVIHHNCLHGHAT